MMKKATAVLDFGTSKVLVLLAEESAYQKVTITSAGMAQYDGFMNGEWNAPSEVSDAIASAIEAAEKKLEPILRKFTSACRVSSFGFM